MKRLTESGNVLFLILVAVALFAALAYAVTSSTRSGGGSADREKLGIDVAVILQQAINIRMQTLRFNVETGNIPTLTTNPGGLYEPVRGTVIQHPPFSFVAENYTSTKDFWVYAFWVYPYRINGVHVGSDLPDVYLYTAGWTEDFCRRMNKELNGSDAIPSVSTVGLNTTNQISLTTRAGVNFDVTATNRIDLPFSQGCFAMPASLSTDDYGIFISILER